MEKNNSKQDIMKCIEDLEGRIIELKNKEIVQNLKYTFDTKNYVYDPDSSLRAWEYYFVMYDDVIECDAEYKEKLFKEDFPPNYISGTKEFYITGNLYKRIIGVFDYSRIHRDENSKIVFTSNKLKVGENIGIAGDCTFNFNEEKTLRYWKCITNDKQEEEDIKIRLKKLLLVSKSMHYSVYNFSLMPANGGMQIVKGRDSFDRLGPLLNILSDFFIENEKQDKLDTHEVLSGISKNYKESRNSLMDFLQKIGNLKNYCNRFYHLNLDKKDDILLFESILKSNRLINTCEDVVNYIDLAVQYWEHQEKHYEEQLKKNKEHITIK